MNTITIGRHSRNDVVINDSKVSRHHLQIIRDNTSNFRAIDLESTNGTFVNNRKISGEACLSLGDTIRIGNTTLPWRTYFLEKPYVGKDRRHFSPWLVTTACAVAVIVFGLIFTLNKPVTPTIVKMKEENGVRYIPAKINGQELNFVFDTGASNICISVLEAMVLIKNGTLTREDFIGKEHFIDATGRVSAGAKISLRTVSIGDRELNNVDAIVVENPEALCLLGQSVLEKFGSYKIDNIKDEIIFE
jgi:aspartyl protease family protein